MQTISPTFSRVALIACSACERPTAEQDLVPHYRGGGNFPLCFSCADTLTQVVCLQCGDLSPRSLLILGVCPCIPACEVAALIQPFGVDEPFSDEEETRYQQWLARREEESLWD